MTSKKDFAVITASDSKYGDFLINHWLKSLLNNIDKKVMQVIVLDYGLNKLQKKKLLSKGVKIEKCVRDGHVVNIRFRDMLRVFKKSEYKQILTCDSGDIIFQKNIMHLFYKNANQFRAVTENTRPITIEFSLMKKTISKDIARKMRKLMKDKDVINGGLVVADYAHFIELCSYMDKNIVDKSQFGPDQTILNYLLNKEGFVNLGRNFNYILGTVKDNYTVKRGVFYNGKGKVIDIVHNGGGSDFNRIVTNFGYGKEYNQVNFIKKTIIRTINKFNFIAKPFMRLWETIS